MTLVVGEKRKKEKKKKPFEVEDEINVPMALSVFRDGKKPSKAGSVVVRSIRLTT